MIETLAVAPDEFFVTGKAWIEATSGLLKILIAELGVIVLALFALRKTILTNAQLEETKAAIEKRLDRQGDKINEVAIAAQTAPAEAKLVQDPGDPALRVTEEPRS